jgi:glucokinase
MRRVLAVDLGGTKISAAVVDETGAVQSRVKVPTPQRGVVEQIVGVASGLGGDVSAAGIIVPGIYYPGTGDVWAPNVLGGDRFPLKEALESALRMTVVIDSDRSGYVAGEQWLGAARGLRNVVFLAVGTGIGAGIIADGRLIRGEGGVAGAVGWFAMRPERDEIPSRIGCLEAEAAGPAVARRLGAASAEAAAEAARRGDARAIQAFEETAAWLAMGIANLISALNPQMVVLGGGLMQAADLLLDPIRRRVRDWAQPIAMEQARIELTQLGEDAGLLGAARLALPSNE